MGEATIFREQERASSIRQIVGSDPKISGFFNSLQCLSTISSAMQENILSCTLRIALQIAALLG